MLAPKARAATAPRRAGFAGCSGIAAAVANSTCCSVIKTGLRGNDSPDSAPNRAGKSDISVPPVSVVLPGLVTQLADGRNLHAILGDTHEYRTTCLSALPPAYAGLATPDYALLQASRVVSNISAL